MKSEKVLSIIMAVIMPFPFIIAGFVSVYGVVNGWCFCFGAAFGIAGWLLGQLFGVILKKAHIKALYFVRLGLILSGTALVILTEILLSMLEIGSIAFICSPLALIMWCWFGYRFGSGQELVPYAALGAYCIEAAFMYPFCVSFEENSAAGSSLILIMTAFLTVAGALLINRRQLSRLSFKENVESRGISKSTERFNIRTTLIFSGILLLLFFFAGFGAKWLWEGVKAFIRFIIWIFNNPLEEVGNDYEGNIYQSPIIVIEEGNGAFWYAAIIIAIIIALILIIKLKPYENLIEYYKKLRGKRIREAEETEYTDIYCDSTEKTAPKRAFRRAVKAYKREKDPTRKFRLGYRAFMVRIGERAERNEPSDTARIHLEKGRYITDFEKLETVVDSYCRIRYGEETAADEDCGIMEELIRRL